MSIWAWATHAAIWTLIIGSVAVFGWFLVEIARIAQRRRNRDKAPPHDG